MKFVQYKDDVKWREGRMFLRGKPVEIEDSYAIGVFSSDPSFEVYKEPQDEKAQGQETPPVLTVVGSGKECGVCHKIIPRGWYMHQKWCKG